MSFEIEVVGEGGLDGCEFLHGFHGSECQHGSLSSSKWQVTVLSPIVDMSPHFLLTGDAKSARRCSIGSKPVSDNSLRSSVPFQALCQELEGCMPVSFLGHKSVQDGAFVVDGTPKIIGLTLDLYEDFVEVPASVLRTLMQPPLPLLELLRKQSTKPVPPKPYRLVTHIDPSLVEQVLDLSQRQRIPNVHDDGELDNGRRSLEIAVRISHPKRLGQGLHAKN